MLFFWTKTGIPNNTYNNIHQNEDISYRIISIPNSHRMNEQQILSFKIRSIRVYLIHIKWMNNK